MNFDAAFDRLIGHEGTYSFHADDPGGETMWGVTRRVATAYGFRGDMRQMTRDTAKDIYHLLYWHSIRAEELPDALRFDVFDAAVNSGPTQAIKWLQRLVGAKEDGKLGPLTLASVQTHDPVRLAAAINGERLDLMTSTPNWAAFGKGWARRIASNLKALA